MSRIVTIFLTILLVARLSAQDGSELAPRTLQGGAEGSLPFGKREAVAPVVEDRSAVLVPLLREIKLEGTRADAEGAVWRVTMGSLAGISGDHITIPLEGFDEVLAPFLGHPLTETGLDRLIETILRYYEANDRPVTDVYAPDQDLENGTIKLVIIDGRVGMVGFEIGDLFNDELLAGAVRLQRDEILHTSDIQEHLDWFNRNPFRPVALFAAPGEGEGDADLVFAFAERRPWRAYAGYENSGAEAAGENRYLAGFNWGNAFGLDQSLNYQFTMGESLEELTAHALSWEIPIHPWHHFVRVTGAWADISTQSKSRGVLVNASGTSWQLGGAYGVQLKRWNDFKQEVTVGVEYKSSDNFVVFGGGDAHPGSVVEVLQFRSDYRASRQFGKKAGLEISASVVASPGGLSGRNTDSDFAEFRAGSEASYLYGRAQATWVQRLPQAWTFRAKGQLQLASGALLPTEQLGFGGHATVRGFEEREFLGDHGYLLSAELRAPALSLPTGQKLPTQVQFLGFLDHGTGWRSENGVGQEAAKIFTSVGGGLRAQVSPYLNLRADLGLPLDGGGGLRGHVGATASF